MKIFYLLLLLGYVAAAPSSSSSSEESEENKKLIVVDKSFFPKEWQVYKSDHDIVSILLPLNSLNFEDNDSSEEDDNGAAVFFAAADLVDGKRVDKGIYIYKDNKAEKILENGRDMAASGDDSKLVFLAASDGLYVYDAEKKVKVAKYGDINDDLIGIAKEKTGDVIYILTANKEVYKVSQNGAKKDKIEDIDNAEQIIVDNSENLFFYGADKKPKVLTSEGVKKITGLPENPSSITLIKPPYLMGDGVPAVFDNAVYLLHRNGTSEVYGLEFKPKYKPSAFALEAALLQYHALDKKIYEYNMVTIVMGAQIEELNDFLGNEKDKIESYASKKNRILKPNN